MATKLGGGGRAGTLKKELLFFSASLHILEGNSDIGEHVRSNLCYMCKAFDLIESSHKLDVCFSTKRPFLFMFAQHVLSYHLI